MGKDSTNSGIPVFGEIVKLLLKQEINTIAEELQSDRYTKRLDSYQHLVIMLYAVLGQFNSLRELELGFLSSATRMNHFGLDYMVRRSTFSDANSRRTPEFFEKVYYKLYDHYKGCLADSRPVKGTKKPLFIIDSTTISLFSQVFRGVGRNPINGQKKGGIKAHTVIKADEDVPTFVVMTDAAESDHNLLGKVSLPAGSCVTFDMGYVDYEVWEKFSKSEITYITREKKKARCEVLETLDIPEEDRDAIISDEIVDLSWSRRWKRPMTQEELSHRRGRRPKDGIVWVKEKRSGKHKCRRITKYKDNKEEGTITFITNELDTNVSAADICETYRQRWQIETLFKRLKQNFPLKYFLGDSRNAIQIQIWVSLIAWLLMQVVKSRTKRKWSLSGLVAAVHILLNSYTGLYAFLNTPEKQWLAVIESRQKESDNFDANSLFSEMRGPNFECQRTIEAIKAYTND